MTFKIATRKGGMLQYSECSRLFLASLFDSGEQIQFWFMQGFIAKAQLYEYTWNNMQHNLIRSFIVSKKWIHAFHILDLS